MTIKHLPAVQAEDLTLRQERFVHEYIINGQDAQKAAAVAGYPEFTPASNILKSPDVQKELQEQLRLHMRRYDITEDRVMREIAAIAFLDIADFYDPKDGRLLQVWEMPADTRRALAGLDVEALFDGKGEDRELTGYLKKFKIGSKLDALEKLAKLLKMYPEKEVAIKGEVKHTHEVKIDLEDRINQLIEGELGDVLN
jgi:phage terminase small subunit